MMIEQVASLTLHLGAPPGEVVGIAENWFASAAAAVTTLLAALALWIRRTAWPPERVGLATLAAACLTLSAYLGSNGPAYLAGEAGFVARLLAELVSGALVLAAVILSLGRSTPREIAALAGGAVLAGIGIGLGGAYTPVVTCAGITLIAAVVSRLALDVRPSVSAPSASLSPYPLPVAPLTEPSAAAAA